MLYLSLLVLALILSSALTSMTEAAIFSAPLARVLVAKDQDALGARRLLAIKQDLQRPVAALVILNNCINIFGSIYVGDVAARVFGDQWLGVFSAVLTFLVIIWSEIVPKTLGERYSLGISLAAAPTLTATTRLLLPLIWLIEHVTRPFASKNKGIVTSEDEIRVLARLGKKAGLITHDEDRLITKAFRLNDVTAGEMMTHRLELASLEASTRLSELKPAEISPAHSRILVAEGGDLDQITGVVHQRDILRALAEGHQELTIDELKLPAVFVHEGTHAQQLLRRFQKTRQHLFVVLDEYGGTRGVVTLEDVLEQLVGDILDETDDEPAPPERPSAQLATETSSAASSSAASSPSETSTSDTSTSDTPKTASDDASRTPEAVAADTAGETVESGAVERPEEAAPETPVAPQPSAASPPLPESSRGVSSAPGEVRPADGSSTVRSATGP